ncbi:MAG: hypothetical protein CMH30_09115 [Micavibrio sp.]|nr:hypothetical protein [Micavibrio sp.]|tara:strand:- start:1192 stop:1848 length:657 start_codon:yes stop_codon:yes gene_type:complete
MTSQRGNALLYVLLGIALFAALSYTLSRNTGTAGSNLSDEKATLMANRLISHAGQVSQAIQQMLMTGSTIEDIDFTKPGEAGYGTNAQHQVFHPAGGGISVFDESDPNWFDPDSPSGTRGWQGRVSSNVGWTPSASDDSIYTFLDISGAICAKINLILNGTEQVINSGAASSPQYSNVFESAGSVDLTNTNCPNCEGLMSACIFNDFTYAFYNVVASQ